MTKGIRLEDLDSKTQDRIIGSLHEQGLIEGLRSQGKNPREIVDALAHEHARRYQRRAKSRYPKMPWYIWALRTLIFMLGYSLLGAGWCLEYFGYYLKRLGEEITKVARRIQDIRHHTTTGR